MAINIKDEETDAKIRELAAISNKSITSAVSDAVDGALKSIKQMKNMESKLKKADEVCKRFQANIKNKMHSLDHADLLYDEKGLPK